MISAASPLAVARICAIDVAAALQAGAAADGAGAHAAQPGGAGHHAVQVQALGGDVRRRLRPGLAAVHLEGGDQVAARHAEVQRRQLQHAAAHRHVRAHALQRQVGGDDLVALEVQVDVGGQQLVEPERVGGQHPWRAAARPPAWAGRRR
jgi:hypothetical protein